MGKRQQCDSHAKARLYDAPGVKKEAGHGPVYVSQGCQPAHGAPGSRKGSGSPVLPGRQGVGAQHRSGMMPPGDAERCLRERMWIWRDGAGRAGGGTVGVAGRGAGLHPLAGRKPRPAWATSWGWTWSWSKARRRWEISRWTSWPGTNGPVVPWPSRTNWEGPTTSTSGSC